MTEDLQTSQIATETTGTARTFQSPPVLTREITAAEQAAIQGPAEHYARNFSTRTATVAGAIGGAIIAFAVTGAAAANRTYKILGALIGGALVGHTISSLPWASKQKPVETSIAIPPVGLPTTPTLPSTPHPAAPTASVGTSEYSGRVQENAPHAELGA